MNNMFVRVGKVAIFEDMPIYVPADLWAVLSSDVSVHVSTAVRVQCALRALQDGIARAWNADADPSTVRVCSRFPLYRTSYVTVDLGIEVDEDGVWVHVCSEIPAVAA